MRNISNNAQNLKADRGLYCVWRGENMRSKNMRHVAVVTREAYSALLNLKSLVEQAADKAHTANMEAVGWAINPESIGDPLRALRIAADTLRPSSFDAAVCDARKKKRPSGLSQSKHHLLL